MREFTDEYGSPILFRLSDVVTASRESGWVFVTFRNGRAAHIQVSYRDFRQMFEEEAEDV